MLDIQPRLVCVYAAFQDVKPLGKLTGRSMSHFQSTVLDGPCLAVASCF